jgi:hypothetical protein
MTARTTQRTPYTVSPELLARPDFRAACEARDFARMFALIKQWDGVSQDTMSAPIEGFGQSRVSKVMSGDEKITMLDLMERICDALRIPGEYFGWLPRKWETPPTPEVGAVVEAAPTVIRQDAPMPAAVNGSAARLVSSLAGSARPTLTLAVAEDRPPASVRIERPVGLRPHIERAFEQETVTIDFAGFSGETLAGALGEPLDKVRSGELTPSSIRVRVLVPDTGRPWSFPCRIEDLGDEPAFRQRAASIADRSLSAIVDAVTELQDMGAVAEAVAEVRVHGLAPQFKLYLINGQEAFFGFYPVTEHMVRSKGTVHAMYDVMGKDSVLFHHSDDSHHGGEVSPAAAYVAQSRAWFESVWASLATDYARD